MTDESEIAGRVESLTESEIRVLGLLSLGWENKRIGKKLRITAGTVKTHITNASTKLQVRNRVALAIFYVDYILPQDCWPDYQPGEKLSLWRRRAEERRELLREVGALKPQAVTAIMLLANPEHAGKTTRELAALMSHPEQPVSETACRWYICDVLRQLPGRSGRARLAVIGRLAPLDVV